jgi:hypothetical protein
MAQVTDISKRRGPVLLLLGLLALLLWGQCAALLFPGTTHGPVAVKGWVKSLDSLGTAPATIYLTLYLGNDLSQPVLVREVSGTLHYGGRAYPFSATAALRDTLLYPWTELLHPIAIPLHLSADSVALLQTTLHTGYPADAAPSLRWQATYSLQQSPTARHKAKITPYLPLPTPEQPTQRAK